MQLHSDLAKSTRLAMLANPYNKDLKLAKAISELNDQPLAGGLNSVIAGYLNQEQQNNLWANTFASRAKSELTSSAYGLILGYDRLFDSAILGLNVAYMNQRAVSDDVGLKSKALQLGVYSKFYNDSNEFELSASINTAKNRLNRNVKVGSATLSHYGKYRSSGYDLGASYGYVLDLGDSLYLKPKAGLNYSYNKNNKFKESGLLANEYSKTTQKLLSASLGIELRKYINQKAYLYISPSLEQELYKKASDARIKMSFGDGVELKYKDSNKKLSYFDLKAGGSFSLSQNVDVKLNLGTKLSKDVKVYSGSVGLDYKF